jgi:hypothetical protein
MAGEAMKPVNITRKLGAEADRDASGSASAGNSIEAG